jgi:transposase
MTEAVSKSPDAAERIAELEQTVQSLEHQLDWFKRQLFGRKSEKRLLEDNPHQPLLDGFEGDKAQAKPVCSTETITYTRNKQRGTDCVNDSGLRFDASVPMKTIRCTVPELEGDGADAFEFIGEERTYRLAQRRSSYVVIEYVRPVIKRRGANKPVTIPAPASVLPGSLADVSLIAGLIVEKLVYHQPLYRQHQRMGREGVTVARPTLTHLVHKAAGLLAPIARAQLESILTSRVLAIDETPIKAGREKKGKMKMAWYWPIYGENDEVCFSFARTRGRQHLIDTLGRYTGTLVSDGHSAYASYARQIPELRHAQCWTHTRREFLKAENSEPEAVAQALDHIGALYHVEAHIREDNLQGEAALACRAEHAKPAVDAFFEWCNDQCQRMDLVPSEPLSKALKYARNREHALRLYLTDPAIPIDTNHVERALRVIPMGRKAWLFNWTEVGAEHLGNLQSLLTTCRLHEINPMDYLIDVLQRIDTHPDKDIAQLTPRLWKTHFADNPLRSDLEL